MLRALLRPSAVVSHALVLLVVVGCVAAGQWQLQRLESVRTQNALLAERLREPPVELSDLITDGGGEVDEETLEFRRVRVSGMYRPEEEVLQRNRLDSGRNGFHVLTPLDLEDGGVVLVRRGWVPSSMDTPPVDAATPPEGPVELTGVLERPVEQPSFGARDPEEGELERVFHTDTDRLDRQIGGELFPMVLRIAATGSPDPRAYPVPPGSPELEERNHLSYAVQWHIFALLAAVTYTAWWWKRLHDPDPARQGAGSPRSGVEDPGGDPHRERESDERRRAQDQQPLA